MRILVTGNLGYLGPEVGKKIKNYFNDSNLSGIDLGLFSQCLTTNSRVGDTYYDNQRFLDIRDITLKDLENYDVVVSLAAVSNDPIGNDFKVATKQINYEANCKLADLCVKAGVEKFIFASSCSMYGSAGVNPKTEKDSTDPLTAYAKSKIGVENTLKNSLSNQKIKLVFLRFATACGASDRLRLDLVLNDFVASAIKYKKISILSDGSPWRPLIDVQDMANSIIWAIKHNSENHDPISINVGSNEWNFNVSDLAKCVAENLPGTSIEINHKAPKDNRSYKVDFSLFKSLAGEFYPSSTIYESIDKLTRQISEMTLPENGFRNSNFIRLNHLKSLISKNKINNELRWI